MKATPIQELYFLTLGGIHILGVLHQIILQIAKALKWVDGVEEKPQSFSLVRLIEVPTAEIIEVILN